MPKCAYKSIKTRKNTTNTEFHNTCGTSGIEDVIKLEDQKILLKCFDGPVYIYDSKKNQIITEIN